MHSVSERSSLAKCMRPGTEPACLSHQDADLNVSWWFTFLSRINPSRKPEGGHVHGESVPEGAQRPAEI